MRRLLELVANAFPLWVLLAAGVAVVQPASFSWLNDGAVVWALAVIMLGMGLTLSLDDFVRVSSRPLAVLAGFVAQFLIMPLAGWGVATALGLAPPLAVGLILVSCCPGGTASNVVTYIARADVALSVVMTACSTLAAVVLTPLLTRLLAGQLVEVGMQNSGLGVVLARRHFPAEPLTAVPCAISSVVHSLIGSVLAGWWRLRG